MPEALAENIEAIREAEEADQTAEPAEGTMEAEQQQMARLGLSDTGGDDDRNGGDDA